MINRKATYPINNENNNIPSMMVNESFGVQPSKPKKRKKINAVAKSKKRPSRLNNFDDVVMGRIMAVPPRIKPRLKILEPITFPMDISDCFVIAALMVTANSGADVPKATTVSPIIKSDTFRVCAISEAESTSQSAPFQSMITEMITRIQSMII